MHIQFNKIAAAMALSFVANGAQAAIATDPNQTGDGELFLSFLNDTASPTSLNIDTGINTTAISLNPSAYEGFTIATTQSAALLSFFAGKQEANIKFNSGGVQTNQNNADQFGALVTSNAGGSFVVADFTHLNGLISNTQNYAVAVNSENNDTDPTANMVVGPVSPSSQAFHDNLFLWSNNVGAQGPDTEGSLGLSNPLQLWRYYLGGPNFEPTSTLLGSWTADFTTGVVTFDAVGSVSPVPVPAAVWLLASALVGFAGVARRKPE